MSSANTTYISPSSKEMMEAGGVEGEIREDGRGGVECTLSNRYL